MGTPQSSCVLVLGPSGTAVTVVANAFAIARGKAAAVPVDLGLHKDGDSFSSNHGVYYAIDSSSSARQLGVIARHFRDFAEIRIVLCRREFIAYVCARARVEGHQNFSRIVNRYRSVALAFEEIRRHLPRAITVNHEDLVHNPGLIVECVSNEALLNTTELNLVRESLSVMTRPSSSIDAFAPLPPFHRLSLCLEEKAYLSEIMGEDMLGAFSESDSMQRARLHEPLKISEELLRRSGYCFGFGVDDVRLSDQTVRRGIRLPINRTLGNASTLVLPALSILGRRRFETQIRVPSLSDSSIRVRLECVDTSSNRPHFSIDRIVDPGHDSFVSAVLDPTAKHVNLAISARLFPPIADGGAAEAYLVNPCFVAKLLF